MYSDQWPVSAKGVRKLHIVWNDDYNYIFFYVKKEEVKCIKVVTTDGQSSAYQPMNF